MSEKQESGGYKIALEKHGLFYNYKLTDFFLLNRDGKKQSIGNIENISDLLEAALEQYGIRILLGSYEKDDLEFRAMVIDTSFPNENEFIFNQIYGFENFDAMIHLKGTDEDCCYDFIYNTDKKTCLLRRHAYQRITNTKLYSTFPEMKDSIKTNGFLGSVEEVNMDHVQICLNSLNLNV